MEREKVLDLRELSPELQAIVGDVSALANSYKGDSLALLALLRTLEALHREIRDGLFQASLPDSRQQFYALLWDIEESGGWPYIDRMKLRSFLLNFSDRELSNASEIEGNREQGTGNRE